MSQPEKRQARSTSPPERNLYHYTDQAGLLGLAKSLEIWATKIQYFNDGHELELGLGLARQQLQQMREEEESSNKSSFLSHLLKSVDQVNTINKYVFSLSQVGDSLSQWRAYCKVGDGFSIGFEKAALESLIRPRDWRIVRCIYDAQEQQRRIRGLISQTLESGTSQKGKEEAEAWTFAQRLADISLEIKNPSFMDEREVRLCRPRSVRKHRKSGTGLVSIRFVRTLRCGWRRIPRGFPLNELRSDPRPTLNSASKLRQRSCERGD